MAVEIQEPRVMIGLDLREMTFQNVVDNILRPSGIKIGGFPEELFLNLTEQECQDMMCNICFLIANDCRLCDNDHVFCHSCIVAWSMTFGENAHKCPVCRCDQDEYSESEDLQKLVGSKQVRCLEEGCCFQSTLAEYLLHDHGKAAYSNAHVDFDYLTQPLIRPPLAADSGSQPALSTSVRSQLLQSRTMIQQMMMLMRIEMQLRQQAVLHFNQSQDTDTDRVPGLDDALALNSQLSEISSVLATLIRLTTAGQRSGQRRPVHRSLPGPQRIRRADTSGFVRAAALRRLNNMSLRQWRDIDSSVNDDSALTDDDNDSADNDDDDDDEAVDVNNMAPVNDIVDNFIWHQLTDSRAETVTVDDIRSPPDGMSAISPISDVQSLASVESAPSFPSLPSISPAASERSLSSIANIASYSPSLSSSISYEGQPGMTRCVVCVNSYELATPEGQCSCEVCSAFDNVTVADDDDDDDEELLHRSCHDIHANDTASEPRPQQLDVSSSSAHNEHVSNALASVTSSPDASQSAAEPVHRTLQPLVDAGHSLPSSQSSLPAADHRGQSLVDSSPLLLLPRPGPRQSPHLNYAARLRRQALEATRLPSQVSIRPWPLPIVSNHLPSPAVSGIANGRVGPSSRSSVRPLPTYNLPPHHSWTAAPARQNAAAGSGRGRTMRSSRYNAFQCEDQTRLPRP